MSREADITQCLTELRGTIDLAMQNVKVSRGFCQCGYGDILQDALNHIRLANDKSRELIMLLFDEQGRLR